MMDVCVIGAGVSGLSAATFLDDAGLSVAVLEAAAEPGGNVRSERIDGRILDRAANGWLDNEPAMQQLLDLLGLTPRLVPASDRFGTRWILADGRLQPAPLGPGKLLATQLLTPAAKLRLALEPFMPRGASAQADDPTADESVGDFVRRRLGAEFVDRMVGPMVAGIYASDPDTLSLRGALNRMFELEREHRSLFVAMARIGKGGAPAGMLHTLPGGAGELTETMARRLGSRLTCDRAVVALEQADDHWRITSADSSGTRHVDSARHVVLACPAPAQARIVESLAPDAAQALSEIPYGPVVVVCTAWSPGSWSMDPEGFGALLARGEAPAIEASGVLGMLFTSSIFPDQAAPGEILLRTILGGTVAPEAFALSDQEVIARARRAAVVALGPEQKPPHFIRVYRHPAGIPHYRVGHPARVARVREAELRLPGLHFVGNHLEGVGVKDCAREGLKVSTKIRHALDPTVRYPAAPDARST
jgi:oxygen-dependent protoporphyrinogen oxidase